MDPENHHGGSRNAPRRTLLWAAVALFLPVCGHGQPRAAMGDATPAIRVAENLVNHGGLYSNSRWPADQCRDAAKQLSRAQPDRELAGPPAWARICAGMLTPVWPLPGTHAGGPVQSRAGPCAGVLTCLLFLLLCLEPWAVERPPRGGGVVVGRRRWPFATPVWFGRARPYTEIWPDRVHDRFGALHRRIAKVQSRRNALC